MELYETQEKKKNGKGALIFSLILCALFTVAVVFSSSLLYEMFRLALLDAKDLGEGLGLALLLIIEIAALAVIVVLMLISIIPFTLSLKSERGKMRSAGIGIFIYHAAATALSIIAFIVLAIII